MKDGHFSSLLLKEWLASDADARLPADASLGDSVSCDASGCVAPLADGAFIALTLQPDAFSDDCDRAAVIVTMRQAPKDCRALVIDRESLQRNGAMNLQRHATGFTIEAIRPRGLDRPWSRAVPEETVEPDNRATGPAVSRPVDATPAETDLPPDDQ